MNHYSLPVDVATELAFLAMVIEHDAANGTTWGAPVDVLGKGF